MGCGNSSAASTAGGQPEVAKCETEDASPDDEKRKNYGGVYVGLPADLSHIDDDIITRYQCARKTITEQDRIHEASKHPSFH